MSEDIQKKWRDFTEHLRSRPVPEPIIEENESDTKYSLKLKAALYAIHFPANAMGVVISDGYENKDPCFGIPLVWTGDIDRMDHDEKPEMYKVINPITGVEGWMDSDFCTLWISDGAPHGIAMFVAKCWQEWAAKMGK